MRNYKPKKVAKYNEVDLKNAVQLVQTKAMNQSEASLTFNIPRGTLQLHLKNPGKKVGAGRPTDLALHDEQIIANTTKALAKWGFGLTKQEFLKSVADYVSSNGIKTQFKENIPGDDWFLNFKKRYNISLRVPEIKQSARFEMFIAERVLPFFTLLANEIKSNGLENKPSQIFNLDETCFNHDPSKVKVLGEVGQTLNRRTIGSGRANTTALACVSASGQVFPPHIIFKSSNCTIRSEWKSDKCYPRTTYDSSESGWMTSETFFSYMKNVFIPGAPAERPLLIIFDGYLSHLSVDVIKLALDNKLVLIKLPAHTTDQLQPLDKVMFRSLKEAYNRRLIKWQRENYGFTFRKCDLVEVIGDAWPAMTTQNVLKGFQATGFFDPSRKFPVNPQVIMDKFPKEQLENFKKTDGFKELVKACDIGPTEDEQRVPESPDSSMMEAEQNAVVPHLQRKESFESLMLRKLEALKELRRGNKKSRRDGTSGEVVTSPEFLKKAEEAEARKKERMKIKKLQKKSQTCVKKKLLLTQTKKKKVEKKGILTEIFDSEEENVDDVTEQPSTSTSVTAKDRARIVKLDMRMKEVQSKLEEENYYAVFYDRGMHIGRIVDNDVKNKEATIKFLARTTYAEPKYDWPKIDDVDVVKWSFIFFGPLTLEGHGPFLVKECQVAEKMYQWVSKYKAELFPVDSDSDFD